MRHPGSTCAGSGDGDGARVRKVNRVDAPRAATTAVQTVREALEAASAAGLDRLDAQLLLAHRLGRPRTWLLAHDDAPLDAQTSAAFGADCARRADGVPLAYLTGRKEFHGLEFEVTPAVLVPRPETELLVDWALELVAAGARGDAAPVHSVVDLGTGSGAVALALKARSPGLEVCATDRSEAALAVARANAARLGLAVEFVAGPWWEPLAGRRFDLAVSNPPYLGAADPHLAALRHEPRSALVAGASGLEAFDRIVAGAFAHLHDGAWLLVEHGADQAPALHARFAAHRFVAPETRPDLAGHPRCTGARLETST